MALDSLNKITIDVSDPLTTPVVRAVQEDIRSRYVEITLVRNGTPLDIPAGAYGMIGMRRADGTYCLYDYTEDETPAVTISGNVVTIYLSQAALSVAGPLYTSVSLYSPDGQTKLTAFAFTVAVEAVAVPSGSVPSTYINILEGLIADAVDAANRAEQAAAQVGDPVSYTAQTRTDAEKAQARTNIGAASNAAASTSAAGIVQLYDGIDSTATNKAATANSVYTAVKIPCNPNLIDNWFFAGGGSQEGDGRFPINQRGQTVYSSGSGYGIDRWWSIFITSTLQSAGLKIDSNLSSQYGGVIRQAIGSPSALAGKTVTFSVLVSSVSNTLTVNLAKSSGMNTGMSTITGSQMSISSPGLYSVTVTLPPDIGGSTYPYLMVSAGAPVNQSATIAAIKLELGTKQTLGYWDGSAWQVREVPNYTEQMIRCQRYQYVFNGRGYVPWGFGMAWDATSVRIAVPLPVPMRSVSGLTSFLSGSLADLLIYSNGAYEVPTAISQNVIGCNGQTASVTFTVPNQAWGRFCMLSAINANARILFDCNY